MQEFNIAQGILEDLDRADVRFEVVYGISFLPAADFRGTDYRKNSISAIAIRRSDGSMIPVGKYRLLSPALTSLLLLENTNTGWRLLRYQWSDPKSGSGFRARDEIQILTSPVSTR
jgi:hypothetical protein